MIWDEVGCKYSPDASKIALVRSESHKNNPMSYKVISAERLTEALGADYRKSVQKCADYAKSRKLK